MLHVYVTCGEWICSVENRWSFVVDEEKRGRLLVLDSTTTLEDLKSMISEDYDIVRRDVKVECSFLPDNLINKLGSPPVFISNDRQVRNFVGFAKKNSSIQLCVTFTPIVISETNTGRVDLNNKPVNSEKAHGNMHRKVEEDDGNVHLKPNIQFVGAHGDVGDDIDDDFMSESAQGSEKISIRLCLENALKKHQRFESKQVLKATLEMCATKYNFNYKVCKSDTKLWIIRCVNDVCNWRLRATCVAGSKCFTIKKYVGKHTCAPSSKSTIGKTPSAKTIARLIMKKYVGVNEGPKANDVIQLMRVEHAVELSYSLAWDALEYAINAVRGIPEKSYGKIPKYLYMLKAANPGTHYNYETDRDGRFKYLFIAFGQSIRGFHKAIRKVVVVDGTFLKNKFKGVLLVATTLDGNSNLYPIAFGVVDSENDSSWDWFMRQLKVVVADEHGLAFVSDRHSSIVKALENVYPQARHGICVHHLISNVVKYYHGKGFAGMISDASKVYRVPEFEERFTALCNASPSIGKYLLDADIRKWARCLFPGLRFDVKTNNPAESINAALRSPREYPIIPLLDSIREMLTRWFHKRRTKSSKHMHPLTIAVEKKIERRIEKGKTLIVYQIDDDQFHVIGDETTWNVDLRNRTCCCGKYNLTKIPCRHAIKAGLSVGREIHSLTDEKYTTETWRSFYVESVNPVAAQEDAWRVPPDIEAVQILPPLLRRTVGRKRKRKFELAEDKIRSQGSKKKRKKCGRCHNEGHNRATCDMPL